jgi:hypothetical protein
VHGVFAVTSEEFIDLANQTSQTEIGAPGQISASVETFTHKLGHAPNQLWVKINQLISALF